MSHHAPHLTRKLVLLLAAVVLLIVWAVGFAAGDTVTLRRDAALSGTQRVTLGDVATLDGPYAEALVDLVLYEASDDSALPNQFELRDVRNVLTAAGVNWAMVSLKGHAACELRLTDTSTLEARQDPFTNAVAAPPTTMPKPPQAELKESDGTVAPLLDAPVSTETPATVRGLIEKSLRDGLAFPDTEVTVAFDRRHAALLDGSTLGAAYEVEPIGKPRLGRVNVRLRRVAGYGEPIEHLISVRITRRTKIVVAAAPIQRHERLTAANLTLEEVELDRPTVSHLYDLEAARGAVCSTPLRPGQPVLSEHLGLPLLVRRGQRVTLNVYRAGFQIESAGFAEADAALGETVEVRLDARRTRDTPTVTGVVSAPGRVVVDDVSRRPTVDPSLTASSNSDLLADGGRR